MKRFMVAALVLAMLVAACGSDDAGSSSGGRSDAEQAMADAIRDGILEDDGEDNPIGEGEATCIGNNAVDQIGLEGLLELGITVENANPDDAFADASDEQLDEVIDITLECVDFRQVLVDTFLAEGEISESSANCLGDALDKPEILRPMAFAGFRGTEFGDDEGASQLIFGAIFECLSIDELEQLGG